MFPQTRPRFRIPALRISVGLLVFLSACMKSEALYVRVDGSSTVYPMTEAVAEDFAKTNRQIRVTIGVSGTGGGLKKFSAGEIDIANASRPIKEKEAAAATANGIEFLELQIAYDGLTVVVNPRNTFVDFLTTDELKRIWSPGSPVRTWKDIRSAWPSETVTLYGPGTDSGTFDFFTEAINGKTKASRSDFTQSEDDHVLVTGISGDPHALGYFGIAYYTENASKLRAIPIQASGQSSAVMPSSATVRNGTYKPLSRPLFIYVSRKAAARPEVRDFEAFYLKNAATLATEVGYIPTPDAEHKKALDAWNAWSQ